MFWHPCHDLLHPQSLDFYQETKTKKDLPNSGQEKLIYIIRTLGGGGEGGGKNWEVS